jgi:hypothetical protein
VSFAIPSNPAASLPCEQLSAAFDEFDVSVRPATIASWAAAGVSTDAHANMTRTQLAAALTAIGIPITRIALAGLAHQGTGPPYAIFGRRVLYRWGPSVAWAEAQLRDPRARASELAAKRAERKAMWAAERYELERATRPEKCAATAE